jgi:predicted nucleotidyltransferase
MVKKVRRQAIADTGIDRERIIATLRAHQAELHRRGVRHAALFGSIARGAGEHTSDIDILIELDPRRPSTSSSTSGLRNTLRTYSRSVSMSPTAAA